MKWSFWVSWNFDIPRPAGSNRHRGIWNAVNRTNTEAVRAIENLQPMGHLAQGALTSASRTNDCLRPIGFIKCAFLTEWVGP
jgi:hypothetical protein